MSASWPLFIPDWSTPQPLVLRRARHRSAPTLRLTCVKHRVVRFILPSISPSDAQSSSQCRLVSFIAARELLRQPLTLSGKFCERWVRSVLEYASLKVDMLSPRSTSVTRKSVESNLLQSRADPHQVIVRPTATVPPRLVDASTTCASRGVQRGRDVLGTEARLSSRLPCVKHNMVRRSDSNLGDCG